MPSRPGGHGHLPESGLHVDPLGEESQGGHMSSQSLPYVPAAQAARQRYHSDLDIKLIFYFSTSAKVPSGFIYYD